MTDPNANPNAQNSIGKLKGFEHKVILLLGSKTIGEFRHNCFLELVNQISDDDQLELVTCLVVRGLGTEQTFISPKAAHAEFLKRVQPQTNKKLNNGGGDGNG